MPVFYCLVGPPGCGKSSFAARLDAEVIATDALRTELTGDDADQSANPTVHGLARRRIRQALAAGRDVALDATNAERRTRKELLSIAQGLADRRVAVVFDVPLWLCLARNATRPRRVPQDVIRRMHAMASQSPPGLDEGFDAIWWADLAGRVARTDPPDAVVPQALAEPTPADVAAPSGEPVRRAGDS